MLGLSAPSPVRAEQPCSAAANSPSIHALEQVLAAAELLRHTRFAHTDKRDIRRTGHPCSEVPRATDPEQK
jgi:hypothetical protein